MVTDVILARNVLVLELGENQRRFTDAGDLVGAGGDVLENLPSGLQGAKPRSPGARGPRSGALQVRLLTAGYVTRPGMPCPDPG
jgi:hypothetical protein